MDTDGPAAPPGGAADDRAPELSWRGLPADPARFPELRRALMAWASDVGLSAEQAEMVGFAGYEALANVAAHAYPDGRGVLDVRGTYRPASGRAEVVVTDHGTWRSPPHADGGEGGRGLLLIDNLAEHTELITGVSGTSVRMCWHVRPPDDARTSASPGAPTA